MKRRNFLKISASGSAGALMLNGQSVSALTKFNLDSIDPETLGDRIMVMIQLKGGNDGLNTLIPVEQYSDYVSHRPDLHLDINASSMDYADDGDGNSVTEDIDFNDFELQSMTNANADANAIEGHQNVYFHPLLNNFRNLYQAGELKIVNGVGYPQINKSHFAGIANVFKGIDGNSGAENEGWMARFLHSNYSEEIGPELDYPLAVQLGIDKPAVGFVSSELTKVDVNLAKAVRNLRDTNDYDTLISGLGASWTYNTSELDPDYQFDEYVDYIQNVKEATDDFSAHLQTAFNAGIGQLQTVWDNNNIDSHSNYHNELADQLKIVSALIKGGAKTKLYLVTIDGFDNHADQVERNNAFKGKHTTLLRKVDEAVGAFQAELAVSNAAGVNYEDKVVSVTFTEFARKIAENGNYGTDHSSLGPMFVIGKPVNGGVSGTNLDISSGAVTGGHVDEEVQRQHDYRDVFAGLLRQWFGANDTVMDATGFRTFSDNAVLFNNDTDTNRGLIKATQNATLSTDKKSLVQQTGLSIYPNPVEDFCNLSFQSKSWNRGSVEIHNLQGALMNKIPFEIVSGENSPQINLSHLKRGTYFVTLRNSREVSMGTQKIIKI
jgi:uncharacterized protein (DUF1501 family)